MVNKISNIQVGLVACEKNLRENLAVLINSTFGYQVSSIYSDLQDFLNSVQKKENYSDVLLIGIDNVRDTTFQVCWINYISKIKNVASRLKVIIFSSTEEEEFIFQSLKAGADGYLTKDTHPTKLLESIREVYDGGAPLSPSIARRIVSSFYKKSSVLTKREIQVLHMLAKGKTHTAIAAELFIDKETARSHIKNIYWKLEVHSKAEAIEKAVFEKII